MVTAPSAWPTPCPQAPPALLYSAGGAFILLLPVLLLVVFLRAGFGAAAYATAAFLRAGLVVAVSAVIAFLRGAVAMAWLSWAQSSTSSCLMRSTLESTWVSTVSTARKKLWQSWVSLKCLDTVS